MLLDPLTGVPAGLLIIVTVCVGSPSPPIRYHHKNFSIIIKFMLSLLCIYYIHLNHITIQVYMVCRKCINFIQKHLI